jgi:hypothetical protein
MRRRRRGIAVRQCHLQNLVTAWMLQSRWYTRYCCAGARFGDLDSERCAFARVVSAY